MSGAVAPVALAAKCAFCAQRTLQRHEDDAISCLECVREWASQAAYDSDVSALGGKVARAFSIPELVSLPIPTRPVLCGPVRERDLGMIYGWRGTGKTYLALGIAYATATGGSFLRWSAPEPAPVLFVDGEMPLGTLRDRIVAHAAGCPTTIDAADIPFRLLAADAQDEPLPNLSTPAGQQLVEPHLAGVRLLVLDNCSTLLDAGDENEAGSWSVAQRWILDLRRRGIAVLLVHHAGKNGQQRGTSRREDVLDLVIGIRRPNDYRAAEGCRFEVEFEKARGLVGDAVEPFEARLSSGRDGESVWTVAGLTERRHEQAIALLDDGLSVTQVAAELKVNKSTISRWKKSHEGQS